MHRPTIQLLANCAHARPHHHAHPTRSPMLWLARYWPASTPTFFRIFLSTIVIRVGFIVSSAAARRIYSSIAITVPVPVPVPVPISLSVTVSVAMRRRPMWAIRVVTGVPRRNLGSHLWRWVVVVSPRSTGSASMFLEHSRRRCGFLVILGVVDILSGG